MNKVSAYLIAKNEADKISRAITSVQWCDEVVVVINNSTDETADIASSLGAVVVQEVFHGFGDLRNRALKHCTNDWILCLDCDEYIPTALAQRIQKHLAQTSPEELLNAPRRNYFWGKWIKHAWKPEEFRHPLLFNKKFVQYSDKLVHEEIKKQPGTRELIIREHYIHTPYLKIESFLDKINLYSTLSVAKLEKKNRRPSMFFGLFHATWSFLHSYLIKLGFLDGWPGLIISIGRFNDTFHRYAKYCLKHSTANDNLRQVIDEKPDC